MRKQTARIAPALVAAALASICSFSIAAPPAFAEATVMVGGAAMYPSKNIIENAVNSKDHTTLVAAVKAAGLVDTLSGKGPFMVFAPTNAAFAMLPAGTVDTLLKPENKEKLVKILTSHVVGKAVMSDAIGKMVDDDKGAHPVKTLSGAMLMASFSLVATLVQAITTDDMRGRVMSVYNVAFRGGMPVGSLFMGPLVAKFGVSPTIACAGALLVGVAAYFLVMHRRVANL